MLPWLKSVVYRSRDKEDWLHARKLLEKEGVEHTPLESTEVPVAGCCARLQPGNLAGKRDCPVFSIEVPKKYKEQAAGILQGKVLPVKDCGFRL